jgi:hypothetical protein
MSQKNYLFKENKADMVFFCHVQVSKKFMATVDAQELELLQWMRDALAHRTATWDEMTVVANEVESRVRNLNTHRYGKGVYLTFTYAPLRPDESGFIRIERTAGRHQSVLLPIIDYRGSVNLTTKDE